MNEIFGVILVVLVTFVCAYMHAYFQRMIQRSYSDRTMKLWSMTMADA